MDDNDAIPKTNIWKVNKRKRKALPLYRSRVSAGFGNPAEVHIEKRLNLQDLCIQHPDATYFVLVQGESMVGADIKPGSILVVDSSIPVRDGCLLVCFLNGDCYVRRFVRTEKVISLFAQNDGFLPMYAHIGVDDFKKFGVVIRIVSLPPKWDYEQHQEAKRIAKNYSQSYVRAC